MSSILRKANETKPFFYFNNLCLNHFYRKTILPADLQFKTLFNL